MPAQLEKEKNKKQNQTKVIRLHNTFLKSCLYSDW